MILAWLTSRLAGPIASAVAVILAGLLLAQCAKGAGLERDLKRSGDALAAARGDLDTCRANTADLKRAVALERQTIADLKSASDQLLKRSEAQLAQAVKGRAKAESDARRLLSTPMSGDACPDFGAVDAALLETLR